MMRHKEIKFYECEYYMLSNFSAFRVCWRHIPWMTSEHAYQAAKFFRWWTFFVVYLIWRAPSAHEAKQIAKRYQSLARPDWKGVKLSVMEDILWAKLLQHAVIQEKLLESGESLLVEDSLHDAYWGGGPYGQGLNHLGRLWMKIRAELLRAVQ